MAVAVGVASLGASVTALLVSTASIINSPGA